MVSTFITKISTVTRHVLHGEPKFELSENHGSLTSKCQLHMSTSLDSAQAKTSSMQRVIINARLLIPGRRAMRTKARQCFNHGSHVGCEGKTVKVLTVSSRSLREHGGNGATPALDSSKEKEKCHRGRIVRELDSNRRDFEKTCMWKSG